jgi:hypothetical protein
MNICACWNTSHERCVLCYTTHIFSLTFSQLRT